MTDKGEHAVPISKHERCPECGTEWAYVVDGKTFSKVIGIVSQQYDRLVEWACPACNHRWDRNAAPQIASQEADE